ncbi:MAG: urease subunit gamma [Clostridiales Family XIII bacterium]|jgi:urease subunit gamma|nr:urease subunit gamma [Clostridiales Family XIII bacterium]
MRLTQKEQEALLILNLAEVSRRRWKRGLKLNYIEAAAVIMGELLERAREGNTSVRELMEVGARIISLEDVMDGAPSLLPMLQFEVLLPDGNKLITIHNPIALEKRQDTVPMEELVSMVC